MNLLHRILYRPFFIRLFNWEYWSFNAIYFPIGFVWVWLCIRARSFFFFSTSNPFIKNAGFLMESKKAIYDIMPWEYYPKTYFVKCDTIPDDLLDELKEQEFNYPLIGKPDVGSRGWGVKKLHNESEVVEYAYNCRLDFLIQEFVPYPNEVGIFYYRYPDQDEGVISGIVTKVFLSVTGDGVSDIRQLCMREKRYVLQMGELEKMYGEKLGIVLPDGEVKELSPYGSHLRGAMFIDDSHLADEQLTHTVNIICNNISDFHYGRLDIRFNTWEELKQGLNFSIINVNGAGAEPVHIYDPRHSVFFAWKEIIRHWIILWRISRHVHSLGFSYMSFKQGRRMLSESRKLDKILEEQKV